MRATVRAVVSLAAVALLGLLPMARAVAAEPALPPGGPAILAWTPDQQLTGYRKMEKIYPVHVVRRGAQVRALPRAQGEIAPTWTWKGQTYDVTSYMAKMRTSGVLVLKDGKVVLERYALGRGPDDRWTSFSVAKSVTSTLIGAAIRDGYIKSLDSHITDYIPELKGSAYDVVTVRQLMTMTSGVKWNEDYTDPNSDVAKAGLAVTEPGVDPIVSYMRRLPREAPAGSKFVYKTGETDLAGVLVSNAVGKPLATYLSEKIWAPYGMEQDAVWVDDPAGHERGGCCISMTLRDYARFGEFILDGGKAGGAQVLPAGWVADASAPHVRFDEHAPLPPDAADLGYGYFWWLVPGGFAAEGIFGQEVFIYPKDRLVIAINSAWLKADEDADWEAQGAFAEAVRKATAAAPRAPLQAELRAPADPRTAPGPARR